MVSGRNVLNGTSVVLFNQLAEIAQQYVHKGSRLYIEGRLQTRKWQGQDGQDRYATEIVAGDLQMLDSKGGQQQGQQGGYQPQQPAQQRLPQQYQSPQQNQYAQQSGGNAAPQHGAPPPGGFDDFDDEIPF